MVKVKYGEPYRTSFGLSEEKIKAKTLGSLLGKIEKKYEGKDYADTVQKYAMIMLNYKSILNKDNLEQKLKSDDEILVMQMIGGG